MPHSIPEKRRTVATLAVGWMILAGCAFCGRPAGAQELRYGGWGVRGGFSVTPDQFVLGAHVHLGELARNLRLDPNVDIGFGDNLTVITLNPDITYVVPVRDAGRLYFGGDIGLVYTRWHSGAIVSDGRGVENLHSDRTDLGLALIAGYEFPKTGVPLALDLKLGLSDWYPDAKLMLCYTFTK